VFGNIIIKNAKHTGFETRIILVIWVAGVQDCLLLLNITHGSVMVKETLDDEGFTNTWVTPDEKSNRTETEWGGCHCRLIPLLNHFKFYNNVINENLLRLPKRLAETLAVFDGISNIGKIRNSIKPNGCWVTKEFSILSETVGLEKPITNCLRIYEERISGTSKNGLSACLSQEQ